MSTVVLADGDRNDRRRAATALRFGGYHVHAVHTITEAGHLLRTPQLAAVILDPAAGDPENVIRALRSRTTVPIIVVSARTAEWDKVVALDAGADDYVTKPFGVEELLARLRAVLRRAADDEADAEPITTPDFTIHLAERRVARTAGGDVQLTPVEWRIIDVLTQHPGRLVPREELLLTVWGPDALRRPGNIRVNLVHIRAKLEPEPSQPHYFLTAPGLGVRFDPTGGR